MVMERVNTMPKLDETPLKARAAMFKDYSTPYSNRNSLPSQNLTGLKIKAADRSAKRSLKKGKGNLGIDYEGLENAASNLTISPNMHYINNSIDIVRT